jgi:hypothetical protein
VAQLHQPPGLQFLQAHAHVGARELQRLGNFVGIQGALRDEDQRINLAHGAVDAPAAAHFAKVGDKLAGQRGEGGVKRHGLILIKIS